MKTRASCLIVSLCFLVFTPGCSYYSGVSKKGRNIYLSGGTRMLLFETHWIKRCREKGKDRLLCEKLKVEDGWNIPAR